MTSLPTARARVQGFLRLTEARMDGVGSASAENRERAWHQLVIVEEREYDFGWMFFYNSKEFFETGDHRYMLGGNAPVIVDRNNGQLYVTGTAHDIDHYLAEYRNGKISADKS